MTLTVASEILTTNDMFCLTLDVFGTPRGAMARKIWVRLANMLTHLPGGTTTSLILQWYFLACGVRYLLNKINLLLIIG